MTEVLLFILAVWCNGSQRTNNCI